MTSGVNIGGGSGVIFPVFALGFLFAVAVTALWVWTLIDCIKNEPSTTNDKIVWVIVIALFHLIGSLLYIIVRRPTRIAQYGH